MKNPSYIVEIAVIQYRVGECWDRIGTFEQNLSVTVSNQTKFLKSSVAIDSLIGPTLAAILIEWY